MRRLICLGTIACLAWSSTAAASASTSKGAGPSSKTKPSLCKKASYTADGGYESAGHFYWEPGDDVTLITNWCYSRGVITSHSVSYTTTIPESLSPQIRTNESLIKGGAVLDVQLYTAYNSNVANNSGYVTIVGHVTARGHHHFVNNSGAGG
jgi:hypothetical protein